MIGLLPLWLRRLLALSIGAVAVAVVWAIFVFPVASAVKAQRDWHEDAAHKLARYRGIVASQAAIASEAAKADALPVWRKLYEFSDAPAARAALQSEFTALLDLRHVSVQSVQPLEPLVEGSITHIGIRVSLALDIEQLQTMLTRMTSHERLLRTDNVSITAPLVNDPETNPSLAVDMEVWGFMRTPEPGRSQ